KILLVEDDLFLANGLSLVLEESGYIVDVVSSGAEVEAAVYAHDFDLIILDLGLPLVDGLEVLKQLRARGEFVPVLILTARDGIEDRVTGLDLGANDYITKPFHLPELEARVRALLRKDKWANRNEVIFGELIFNTVSRTVTIGGTTIDFSPRELAVLETLVRFCESTVSKERLANLLSSFDEDVSYNAVGIIIHRLRRKLEPLGINIKALRGLGYRLENRDSK
ncbi:MAG TPA: response regulator transcription factor, partial [Candidatus Melainabacteria bacterium]|nr:response regulator transcription factor [Candidatus Melainabacteria bacterium]